MCIDMVYKWWNCLEELVEVFVVGYWVYIFDKLLFFFVYGKIYFEYYFYFKGKCYFGKVSQWCLINFEVLEIVFQCIDFLFKVYFDKKMICVS